jgi:hypothetical protein
MQVLISVKSLYVCGRGCHVHTREHTCQDRQHCIHRIHYVLQLLGDRCTHFLVKNCFQKQLRNVFCSWLYGCPSAGPVALLPEGWLCDCSQVGTVGSNPAGVYMSVFWGFCLTEFPVSGLSLVQRSLIVCGVSEFDGEASVMGRPKPTRVCRTIGKRIFVCLSVAGT